MAKIVITLQDEVVDGISGVDLRVENDSPAKKGNPSTITEAHRLLGLIMGAIRMSYESQGPEEYLDAAGNPLPQE